MSPEYGVKTAGSQK